MEALALAPETKTQPVTLRDVVLSLGMGNVFEDFDHSPYTLEVDMAGGATRPIFEQIIGTLRPRTMIEVGTWTGASAIHMAKLLKQHAGEATLVCIDTWLGSHHLLWADAYRPKLHLKHGFPMQYFQFLANVMKQGCEDVILPLPMTSTAAANYLLTRNVQVDCIYIDASHDEEDVYNDAKKYWKLLRPGGIMFGDDYSPRYPGCVRAVNHFAYDESLRLQIAGKKWMVEKPHPSTK